MHIVCALLEFKRQVVREKRDATRVKKLKLESYDSQEFNYRLEEGSFMTEYKLAHSVSNTRWLIQYRIQGGLFSIEYTMECTMAYSCVGHDPVLAQAPAAFKMVREHMESSRDHTGIL